MVYTTMRNLLKTEELARELQITPETVRKLAKAGKLPSYRIGSAYRFDLQEIQMTTKQEILPTSQKPNL